MFVGGLLPFQYFFLDLSILSLINVCWQKLWVGKIRTIFYSFFLLLLLYILIHESQQNSTVHCFILRCVCYYYYHYCYVDAAF